MITGRTKNCVQASHLICTKRIPKYVELSIWIFVVSCKHVTVIFTLLRHTRDAALGAAASGIV